MRKLLVAPRAQRDIDAALHDSAERHGLNAARRYRRLIYLTIQSLHEHPDRPAARSVGDGDLRLYALRTAARQLGLREPVRAPSHLVVFRFDDQIVRIVRVLHEAMDLPRHLGSLDQD
jgi:toxin ParE1/3/4